MSQPVSHLAQLVAVIVGLLLIAAAMRAFTRRIRLPLTVVLVLVGMLLAFLSRHYAPLGALRELVLSPDLILYVFLPTLVFESAFNLDARSLRRNLPAVLLLAIPGLLLSTALIGLIISALTPIPLPAALLLGAILSATDPVAVVALFRQLAAPKRLLTLVEGESLFNDATSIVLARILLGVFAAGAITAQSVLQGVGEFFVLFAGGLLVGSVLGGVTGYLLGKVENDPAIEITLTTVVAYLAFLLSEEMLGVSGVMAVVATGVILGGWGRLRVTPPVRIYLEHFWEYMAFVANALIFLLVGLSVQLAEVWSNFDLLLWVIIAMLLSRAAMVYGLMPLVGRLPGSAPVSLGYQTVMFWGGLRGAIALAIVLSLPPFEFQQTFVALVMGAVLFTLLIQGLSIERLMHHLGLDRLSLADRIVRLESSLAGKQRALARIPELQRGGLFSASVAQRQEAHYQRQVLALQHEIGQLRAAVPVPRQAEAMLYARCFAEEKAIYVDLYNKGHVSERAYRDLVLILNLQLDAIRHHIDFRSVDLQRQGLWRIEHGLLRICEGVGLSALAERLRRHRISVNFEHSWGHYQASVHVLAFLQSLAASEPVPQASYAVVRHTYQHWCEQARQQIDLMTEQYPEFVAEVQDRLGRRLALIAEQEVIDEEVEHGVLTPALATMARDELVHQLNALRGQAPECLEIGSEELLRKVPFFRDFPAEEFALIARVMRPHTFESGEVIVSQGEPGDSLFLIARGVVRIALEQEGVSHDVATLMAGDFIGEMALLHREPRSATARAVTPAILYELGRSDMNHLIETHPLVRSALQEVDRQRRQALEDAVERAR